MHDLVIGISFLAVLMLPSLVAARSVRLKPETGTDR